MHEGHCPLGWYWLHVTLPLTIARSVCANVCKSVKSAWNFSRLYTLNTKQKCKRTEKEIEGKRKIDRVWIWPLAQVKVGQLDSLLEFYCCFWANTQLSFLAMAKCRNLAHMLSCTQSQKSLWVCHTHTHKHTHINTESPSLSLSLPLAGKKTWYAYLCCASLLATIQKIFLFRRCK